MGAGELPGWLPWWLAAWLAVHVPRIIGAPAHLLLLAAMRVRLPGATPAMGWADPLCLLCLVRPLCSSGKMGQAFDTLGMSLAEAPTFVPFKVGLASQRAS